MTKKISLDEIQEGYILAETLTNKYNQILIKKGSKLNSTNHIRILKMWGIESILILENKEEENSENNNNNKRIQIEEELLKKINWNSKNSNDKYLIDIAVLSKLGEEDFE